MPRLFRWIAVLLLTTPATAAIRSVLPFTPEADAVRVVVRVDGEQKPQLSGTLTPAGGGDAVWEGSLGDGSGKLIEHLKVQPWSPGSPKLYQLTVKTAEGASHTVRFGFRKIESKEGHVLLNGKPIFLRGLAINPPGRSVPEAVGESRQFAHDYVKYLRDQHINLIRLEHDNQDWFDVCDELGMMVYQGFYGSPPSGMSKAQEAAQRALETQDEAAGKRLPPDNQRSFKAYQETFETYVRHPSIVIYVLSNEMPYKGAAGKKVHDFLTAAYEHLSKWDRTRLCIGNAGYGEGNEGDINDVHRYWGWYYNSFATYYNLRDEKLFGDPAKNQPFTFSECVGNFTGPDGAYNCIERKQLGAAMAWTGFAPDQSQEAQAYQAFMTKQACESFRRMRAINPRISGLMPFTITFRNWRGIQSFDEMKPTAAAKQFGISYQPVLLSFEHWQPNVYAGKKTTVFAHVVNDADDFSELSDAKIQWEFGDQKGEVDVPNVAYYGTWRGTIDLTPAKPGQFNLIGRLVKDGKTIAENETPIFVAGTVEQAKPERDMLIIEEGAWDKARKAEIHKRLRDGGRVLCFGQDFKNFDTDWLPAKIEMNQSLLNDPEYGAAMKRPARDGMHVNLQRPDHPVFAGIDRQQFKLWSDPAGWDQTQDSFPNCYPVNYGFKLTNPDDLKNVAILADYDQGLSGVALCEMFQGKGSVMLCAFGLKSRAGIDPVADRLRANLINYMASDKAHQKYPLVKEPIRWGDYATHQGTISGPINGFWINTIWLAPPTDPDGTPLPKNQVSWNTRPSDQFVPHGIRPRGQFSYTFNNAPRDADKDANGSGILFATVPQGRKGLVTKVENPTSAAAELKIEINGATSSKSIDAGATIHITTPLPDERDLGVRYSGDKGLVILESDFR